MAHIPAYPLREKISYFYRFDDIKCRVSNCGCGRKASKVRLIHVWDLHKNNRREEMINDSNCAST